MSPLNVSLRHDITHIVAVFFSHHINGTNELLYKTENQ